MIAGKNRPQIIHPRIAQIIPDLDLRFAHKIREEEVMVMRFGVVEVNPVRTAQTGLIENPSQKNLYI